VFGRRTAKSEPETVADATEGAQGKGRPTPKRSEAEAARKQRLKAPANRREAAARQRERAKAERGKMKAAMDGRGDQRDLPRRDRGPVRRFSRDFVDSRRNVAEFLLPALLLILLLPLLQNLGLDSRWIASLTGALWLTTIVLTVLDVVYISWRLKKELAARFPDEDTKGARLYAVLRASQVRFLRLPKPQVKPGATLPTHYR
jgi:hypothetical protein